MSFVMSDGGRWRRMEEDGGGWRMEDGGWGGNGGL